MNTYQIIWYATNIDRQIKNTVRWSFFFTLSKASITQRIMVNNITDNINPPPWKTEPRYADASDVFRGVIVNKIILIKLMTRNRPAAKINLYSWL